MGSTINGAPIPVGGVEAKRTPFPIGSLFLLVLVGAGAFAGYKRMTLGLGAVTNMSDRMPWGLWIAADVLCGVALAAGGFGITAAVYVFNMKKYKPIARPAVLTAFLGYMMVAIGIIFDIGKPLAIYHPLLYPQIRSVMFEVAMCVMLYLTVLSLEFAPAFLERFRLAGLLKIFRYLTFPLVIAGIVLSFLHQSSLGAVFLIAPSRLSPLWYSPFMPQMFYLSAITAGLAMVAFESIASAWVFGRAQETEIVRGLARGTMVALCLYLVAKVVDLAVRGALPRLFEGTAASRWFAAELAIGVVLPLVLLAVRKVRESIGGIFLSCVLVIAGVVLNRLNVNFFAQADTNLGMYFPSRYEFMVTIGLVALAVLLYRVAATFLPVFHEEKA